VSDPSFIRRWRAVLVLELLASIALAVSLSQRVKTVELRWESYVPLEADRDRVDFFEGMGVFDARLWLGLAIGFAVAGLVVAVSQRRRQR
jgi:hypothetical protein